MPRSSTQPLTVQSVSLVLLTSVLWGATPVAISYSLDTLPPVGVAAIRFTMAVVFMLVWCRIERTNLKIQTGQLRPILILAVMLFAQITLFHIGIHRSSSSHGSLFINTFVLWVVLIEHFVTKIIRLSPRRLAGLAIAAFGAYLILSTTDGESQKLQNDSSLDVATFTGDLILLASAFLLGIKIVYTKQVLKIIEPGKLIFWHAAIAVVLFIIYSWVFEEMHLEGFTMPAILGLLYQGFVVAGFCFAVQGVLLRRHTATQISVFAFTVPIFGITIGVLMRGDPLSPWLLVSGVCVAVGILLVNINSGSRN